jgi:DNA-binding transcriptional LysR family regulator
LIAAVAEAAPRVSLDLRPSGTLDIIERLDRGELDVAICSGDAVGERFAQHALFDDPFVVVMRRGHPAQAGRRKGGLSAEALAGLPHLEISSSGDDTGFIDRRLAERGLARRIADRAPYLAAATILARSDMIATLRRRIAAAFVRTNALDLADLPFDSPVVVEAMLWHRRFDNQPGHRWLRETIIAVSRGI